MRGNAGGQPRPAQAPADPARRTSRRTSPVRAAQFPRRCCGCDGWDPRSAQVSRCVGIQPAAPCRPKPRRTPRGGPPGGHPPVRAARFPSRRCGCDGWDPRSAQVSQRVGIPPAARPGGPLPATPGLHGFPAVVAAVTAGTPEAHRCHSAWESGLRTPPGDARAARFPSRRCGCDGWDPRSAQVSQRVGTQPTSAPPAQPRPPASARQPSPSARPATARTRGSRPWRWATSCSGRCVRRGRRRSTPHTWP